MSSNDLSVALNLGYFDPIPTHQRNRRPTTRKPQFPKEPRHPRETLRPPGSRNSPGRARPPASIRMRGFRYGTQEVVVVKLRGGIEFTGNPFLLAKVILSPLFITDFSRPLSLHEFPLAPQANTVIFAIGTFRENHQNLLFTLTLGMRWQVAAPRRCQKASGD